MTFAYVLKPSFDLEYLATATPEEHATFQRHGAYLQQLHVAGVIRFAGRCLDGPLALVVVDTTDATAARRVMDEDPTVAAGIQQAELYPFDVFLERSDPD